LAGKTTPWKFCKWDAGACAAVGADAVVDRKLDAVARGVLQRREYYLLHGAEEFLAHGEMNEEARSRRLRKEGTHLKIARGRHVHQLVLPHLNSIMVLLREETFFLSLGTFHRQCRDDA